MAKVPATALEDYWTPEAIEAAAPMMMIDTTGDGMEASDPDCMMKASNPVGGEREEADNTVLPKGQIPSGKPQKGSEAFHRHFYPGEWERASSRDGSAALSSQNEGAPDAKDVLSDITTGTMSTFTDYPVNEKPELWHLHPHKVIGLFTFTGTNGSNYICSATAVRNNHIVTAAHCVYDTELDRSYTNKAFHPAYRSGTRPYGVFPVHACVVLKT